MMRAMTYSITINGVDYTIIYGVDTNEDSGGKSLELTIKSSTYRGEWLIARCQDGCETLNNDAGKIIEAIGNDTFWEIVIRGFNDMEIEPT